MKAKFRGEGSPEPHGLVTCRVANTVLEPFFAEKPVSLLFVTASATFYLYTP